MVAEIPTDAVNHVSLAFIMASVQLSPVNRRIFIVLELEQAIECLRAALERIAEMRMVLREDAATLFLLSNGLERYLKVGVHLLHFQQHGDFRPKLRSLGHGPLKAEAEIFGAELPAARSTIRGREDLEFATTNELIRALLECLNAFAESDRYFMLDGVAGEPVDPERNPREMWETVLSRASDGDLELFLDATRARSVIAPRLISCVQRYLRCIAQSVHYSTTGDANALGAGMNTFLLLRDACLETPVLR